MNKYRLVLLLVLILSVLAVQAQKKRKIKKNVEYVTESGLKYTFYKINKKAPKADSGDVVAVNYVGKLANDTVFDSSYSRNQPITFKLGTGRVIKGWEEGIALMHEGDSALLVIPPEIGYGERDMKIIPPNSTLYFTVVLEKVQKPVKPYDVAGLDTISLDSGLKYIEVKRIKKGILAKGGDRVYVNYTGYFTNGKIFDASYDRGEPLVLVLGRNQVIIGWEMGLQGMRAGEKRRLLIPYQLAYGEKGRGSIPPKADLVFDVEMMKIEPDAIPKPFDISGKDTITTKSGLKYVIIKKTDGEKVVPGDTVILDYVVYFPDGKILESTYERNDSLIIVAGQPMMIPGIMEAVELLRKGEKARFIIPYKLAFGEAGRPPVIPAKTDLIFDVRLRNIRHGKLQMPDKQ